MPDKNFEQQAQDMANGFGMEPSPASWQQIRDAIGKKRKRRIAIWWWLLPLCLVAGGITLYTFQQINKQVIAKNALINSTIKSKNTEEQITLTKPDKEAEKLGNSTVKNKNTEEQTQPDTPNKNDEKQEVKINKNLAPAGLQKENNVAFEKHYKNDSNAIYSSEKKIISAKKTNENKVADADKNVQINKTTIAQVAALKNNKKPEFDRDNATDTIKNAVAENKQNSPAEEPALAKNDSAINQQKNNDTAAVILPLKQDTAAPVAKINKQKKLRAWHFGIVAEGGIATRSSAALSLAGEKSTTNRSPAYFSLSTAGSINSGNQFYNEEQIQHGAAYGFGIALQKLINKKIDFFADAAYQHQSSKISAVTYYDSIMLNGTPNVSLAGSYNTTQAFHFVSVFTGFNWHFINKKNISFGISAGADNFFLLSAKQKFSNIISANTVQDYAESVNSSALVKHNYYAYQPNLFAGILINVKMPANQQLQFSPFMRSGINKFEKNISANNNHLFSGGVRAVYLFK